MSMQQYTRNNCFSAWANVRLAKHGIQTTNIYKDLFKGFTLKHLVESFLGRDMKKMQSCDDLTDQQKKMRIEWIITELQDTDVLPYNYVYDKNLLVINDFDEVSWFLWHLVKHDIREIWDATGRYLADPQRLITEHYSWIPDPSMESPAFNGKEPTFKEMQSREKSKKHREKKKKMKPEEGIVEIVQMYIEENTAGGRKCPPFNDLEDLSDSRILLRLINALLPQTFTPEVLLNDRWTIKLALSLLGKAMEIKHKVDAEDLVHCDVMAICAFCAAFLMKGLSFRQARAVVDRIDIVTDKICKNSKIMEELPNIAQTLDTIRQKKEVTLKLEVLGKELCRLQGTHDTDEYKVWLNKLKGFQEEVNAEISKKIVDRFELLNVPRSTTINSLVKFMYINLNLTTGIAFYTSNSKEVVSPERKLILYDKKEKAFYDDFSGADNCPHSVRHLLDIPSREIAEVKSDQYEDKYEIYFESPSRNKLLKAGSKLLYQVFPGSATQCERALFKAVKSGEFDTVDKLVKFYKGDLRFVNATYRESGNSSLHFAVKGQHFRIALFLLESGSDVNMQNKILQTPLFLAVESLDRQMAGLLIEWGADIYMKNINAQDVLKLSRNDALKEFLLIKFEMIKTLISKLHKGDSDALSQAILNHHHHKRNFASLRSRVINGQTLLHVASRLGAVPVIELLMDHRLDVDICDSRGRTSLHYVNDLQTAAILLEARANVKAVDIDGNTPLHTLCLGYSATGDDQFALEDKASALVRWQYVSTKVHEKKTQVDVGQLLLENGCSVLARNKKGYLPLHCCAIQGRADYIKLLLSAGGNDLRDELDSEENSVSSLLKLATEAGHWRCAEWLLKNDFKFKPGEGEQIVEALLTRRITHTKPHETVSFLINLGTDPCHKNPKDGNQPLHYAAMYPMFAEVLSILIESGADVEAENDEGETPLFSAIRNNNCHAAQALISKGADIHHKNKILLDAFQCIEDFDEWIMSGVLSEEHCNLLRALSLQENQQTVKTIMRKVRSEGAPAFSAGISRDAPRAATGTSRMVV